MVECLDAILRLEEAFVAACKRRVAFGSGEVVGCCGNRTLIGVEILRNAEGRR